VGGGVLHGRVSDYRGQFACAAEKSGGLSQGRLWSAAGWAGGYTFPPEYVQNDVACLEVAQGDIQAIVRQCLEGLAPGRLNAECLPRLQPDNLEPALLHGMKVWTG
jgi:hypothetical protein